MERLTEKVKGEYIHKVHKFCLNDCYQKLGKLEDIEEELGITLEVLFKALKEGIWCKDFPRWEKTETLFKKHSSLTINIVTDKLGFEVYDQCCGHFYNIEDYRKTWALTREELE